MNDANETGGTGGACDDSDSEAAEDVASFEDEDAVGVVSPPPLARRSRMTNPCSSSAMVPSPTFLDGARYPTIGCIPSQADAAIEEAVTLGIEWHSISRSAEEKGRTGTANVDTFYESR